MSDLPNRYAAIDVGSNAIRFLAAEFAGERHYAVLEQIRVPVRLGHDVFVTGRLTSDAMQAAVEAFRSFSQKLNEHGVAAYRAVATSAVRESRNGKELIERAAQVGITIEVINGGEEARLVHLAVRDRLRLGRRKWLIADLGGGSVEVSIVDDQGIHRSESYEMGSVRLLEELAVAGDAPGQFRRRLEEYTATLRNSRILHANVTGFVATGGNIEALAKLAAATPDTAGVAVLGLNDLRALIERLSRMSYNDRVSQLGLRTDRADVILPAAMVYERIAVLAGTDTIIVPNVGVKDGIVIDLRDRHASKGRRHDAHQRTVLSGALALGRRFHFDEPHARHVTRLAASLFDQLGQLHGLEADEKKLLMCAAMLHDIGVFISLKKHHKHSLYIINEAELPGLSQNETAMVANIARYHRKSAPSEHHEHFTRLAEEDREKVVKLSALLRLADALDREHLQRVERVEARHIDGKVVLDVRGRGDLLLERWALQKKAQLFEKTFGVDVKMEAAAA